MFSEGQINCEGKELTQIKRIGIDLDDTAVDYGSLYLRAIMMGLGINIPALYPNGFSCRTSELPEIAALPQGPAFINNLIKRELFYRIAEPIPGAVETLNEWRNTGFNIWFITARMSNLSEVTFEWLRNHNLGWAVEKTILKEDPLEHSGEYKNRICRQLDLQAIIDDSPKVLSAINAPSVRLRIGLKKIWNMQSSEQSCGYNFYDNWQEIRTVIEYLTE